MCYKDKYMCETRIELIKNIMNLSSLSYEEAEKKVQFLDVFFKGNSTEIQKTLVHANSATLQRFTKLLLEQPGSEQEKLEQAKFFFLQENNIKQYIQENIIFARDVAEILGVSKQYVSQLKKENKIVPVKKDGNADLYLLDDILDFKQKR